MKLQPVQSQDNLAVIPPQDLIKNELVVAGVKNDLIETIMLSREVEFLIKKDNTLREIEKIQANIALLKQVNIGLDHIQDPEHPLIRLFFTPYLKYGLYIAQKLEINDLMQLRDIVWSLDIECKSFLHEGLFEECLEYFGKEKLRTIFTCNNQTAHLADGSDLNRAVIHNQDYMKLAIERNRIIEFCSHLSMPSGYSSLQILSIEDYTFPVDTKDVDHREVHYLGSYASEIRYFIEKLGIPFETLFALEKATLASYCGIFRSLCISANRSEGVMEMLDFITSREPCVLEPKEIFTRKSLAHFLMQRRNRVDTFALKKLEVFIDFLRQNTPIKYPQLSERNIKYMMGVMKKYREEEKIKREQRELQEQQEREESERLAALKGIRLGRNYNIIGALAENLSSESPFRSILLGEGHKEIAHTHSKTGFLRQYNQAMKDLDRKYAGLYSIGGKIHFPHSISEENIDEFSRKYKFQNTPFKMIHANTSLLLPPSNFPEELMFMISCMSDSGLFGDDPQLQISIPGRLPNQLGGILGSSMILLSNEQVEYSKESFGTTHDSMTGRRMVTYDAGEYDPNFKWNSNKIKGRTDVLLLKDINLIPKAKVIGSLLSQTIYDGRFAELGMDFVQDYAELLVKYNMEGLLQGPWIYESNVDMDVTLDSHYNMVKSLTDKHSIDWLIYNHTKQKQGLMVFELKKLLTNYWKRIELLQHQFIH